MKNIIVVILILISAIDGNEGPLQYPEPPEGWADGDCQSTQIQSPINIPSIADKSLVKDNGDHATIESLSYSDINSGEVKFDKNHKWTSNELDIGYLNIKLNKTEYKYKVNNIHFHLNSEHRIENKQYPMEMHIVHKNTNTTDKDNENLVIGVLFDYNSEYADNKFLNDINLAEEKEMKGASILSLINKNDEFYYYKGGLTTVPCTENVNWIVFKDIKHMSFAQFDKFRKWIESSDAKYYGRGYGNARGPKNLSNRQIYLENCKTKLSAKLKELKNKKNSDL
jgi:carbonic anhydrase